MVKKNGVGWAQDDQSVTSGETYAEFVLADEDPIQCHDHLYTYESAPEDDWPGTLHPFSRFHPHRCFLVSHPAHLFSVLIYTVAVERSWEPYARGYILTQS